MAKRIARNVMGIQHFKIGGINFIRAGSWNLAVSRSRGKLEREDDAASASAIGLVIRIWLLPLILILAVWAVQMIFPWAA